MDSLYILLIVIACIIVLLYGISSYNANKYVSAVAIERAMQVGGFIKGMLKKNKKK